MTDLCQNCVFEFLIFGDFLFVIRNSAQFAHIFGEMINRNIILNGIIYYYFRQNRKNEAQICASFLVVTSESSFIVFCDNISVFYA